VAPAFLLAVVAARVDGSASLVAARRLKRLLEPLTNSSSAARSVTLSSEAMSFSDFARVTVFATIEFEVCVVFAIFVFPSLSGGRHQTPIIARTDQRTTAVIAAPAKCWRAKDKLVQVSSGHRVVGSPATGDNTESTEAP
jgi:hypothetical protein